MGSSRLEPTCRSSIALPFAGQRQSLQDWGNAKHPALAQMAGRVAILVDRWGVRLFRPLAVREKCPFLHLVVAMKVLLSIVCCLFPLAPLVAEDAGSTSGDEAGFVSLFDGKSTSGWEGPMEWFRIENKSLVGGTLDKGIPHNYFLCTTETYGDFELRLEVKVVGDNANAGVQFRTKRIKGSSEVEGYQADVGGVGKRLVWGSLYDESRRRKFMAEADAKTIEATVKPNDWNDYRIRCVGPKIELFLNGVQTVSFLEEDDTIAKTGVIALQIHSGPPTEAWYRNIRIKPL